MAQVPRVLVIATKLWPLAARISIALSRASFRVAALSPPGSVIRKVNAIGAHYTYRPWAKQLSVMGAINAYSPDYLVCTDDDAVAVLHHLHLEASRATGDEGAIRLARLIEASLGNPASFAIAREKSRLIAFAQGLGVRCPRTVFVPDENALEHELREVTYPIVVKADGTSGGAGVRIAYNREDARTAFQDLAMPGRWLRAFVKSFDELTFQPLLDWASGRRQVVTLQEYVSGRPANRAVVCGKGEILAGLSVEVHETRHRTGPSTVAGIIDHPEMRATVEILARRLELTGFHGFDFVIDSANQAWLLELNSRVTSISHFSVGNLSPAAAWFSYLTGTKAAPAVPPAVNKLIALFPQEWQRCSGSDHLYSCYHDVPWDEPEFVRACLSPYFEVSIGGRIRKRLYAVCGFGQASVIDENKNDKTLFDLAKRATKRNASRQS